MGTERDTDDVEQERIPAGFPHTPAVSVSHRRQRIGHGQHEIEFFALPVLEPLRTIVFTLRDEGIELMAAFHAPTFDERRVDLIAEDVAVEPGIKRDQESGKAQCEEPGFHAGVLRLAPTEG